MINVKKQTDCCGCSACEEACPKQCIQLEPDKEGYWYPKINKEQCIDCGVCEKVCPVLNSQPERIPLHVYAAINKNEKIRAQSASGGMFTLIAEKIIHEGGVVFGVKFDKDWKVVFGYTETQEGLDDFRRSKYVQAWVGNSYKEVKEFLKQGRKVLFTGVPCQIAGLYSYLRKNYENLITVDLICEGVPSPKLWERYLKEEIVQKTNKIQNSISSQISQKDIRLKDVSFRNKENGWKKYSFSLTFSITQKKNEEKANQSIVDRNSAYLQMMFRYANLRPICYECPFKSCKSQSDITIADYWGIDKLHPEMDDDKGTSMVFINTIKGETYFDFSQVKYLETTYQESWPFNNVVTSSKKHPKRDFFYENVDSKKDLIKFMNSISFPLSFKIKKSIKLSLKKIILTIAGEKGWIWLKNQKIKMR